MSGALERWTDRARVLGHPVRFYPSQDFDEVLAEEGFPEEQRPHVNGLIFMDSSDPDAGIYIRGDLSAEEQLRALIHEVLHAEMPGWDEDRVHIATEVEMQRMAADGEALS